MQYNPVFQSWYTDSVDIYRTESVKVGNLNKMERVKKNPAPVACRIVNAQANSPHMGTTGSTASTDHLSCDIGVDIRKGDELIIVRGGRLNSGQDSERYFAGKPLVFYDPVAGIATGLEHMEIPLLMDEIIG